MGVICVLAPHSRRSTRLLCHHIRQARANISKGIATTPGITGTAPVFCLATNETPPSRVYRIHVPYTPSLYPRRRSHSCLSSSSSPSAASPLPSPSPRDSSSIARSTGTALFSSYNDGENRKKQATAAALDKEDRETKKSPKLKLLKTKILGHKKLILREDDLEEQFVRGGGKGGQKINKVMNMVVLTHIPTGIQVKCQDGRSLSSNRAIARKWLQEKVEMAEWGKDSKRGRQIERQKKKKARSRRRAIKKLEHKSANKVAAEEKDDADCDEDETTQNEDHDDDDSDESDDDEGENDEDTVDDDDDDDDRVDKERRRGAPNMYMMEKF